MGVRINPNSSRRVLNAFRMLPKKIEEVMIRTFTYVGIQMVNKIKNRPLGQPNWTDRTGNLRSSVGYILFVDGKEREVGGFEIQGGTNPTSGVGIGEQFARQFGLAVDKSKYTLVIVAGMNYAEYVEKKDYDVILFVEDDAKELLRQYLKTVDNQIQQEINKLLAQ